jgi:hypothetical protein
MNGRHYFWLKSHQRKIAAIDPQYRPSPTLTLIGNFIDAAQVAKGWWHVRGVENL